MCVHVCVCALQVHVLWENSNRYMASQQLGESESVGSLGRSGRWNRVST